MAVKLKSLTDSERRWVAEEIAGELRRKSAIEGLNPLQRHRLLVRFNVFLARMAISDLSEAAYFAPEQFGMFLPMVLDAAREDDPKRAKRIAHELAHHLMREWVAPALYETDTVYCDRQDNPATRHAIARRVEHLAAD